MADYTVVQAKPVVGGTCFAQPAMQTLEIEVDLTNLPAVLATGDTVAILAIPAGFCIVASSIEVVEPMVGTSLVGPLFNLEEAAGSTDLSGTVIPTTAGNRTQATIADATAAATNLELVFALTSGTVTDNGKLRVKVVAASI